MRDIFRKTRLKIYRHHSSRCKNLRTPWDRRLMERNMQRWRERCIEWATHGESKIHFIRTRSTFKEGRRFLAGERNYNASSWMHQATSQRTATMHVCVLRIIVCVCMCVWAGLLELSSAYLRCTMHSLSLPTLGKARRGEFLAISFVCAEEFAFMIIERENFGGGWLCKYTRMLRKRY